VLGQLAEVVVAGINGVTGTQTPSLAALTSPNPGRAARAVRHHKKVMILFRNDRGLDDRAMAAIARQVEGRTRALVLTDDVGTVDRYGKLVEDLGVSQTPSVVIIDRFGKAQLIEGYVDAATLTQAVTDAR
jgi:negative regulator of replication initiation